MDIKVNGKAFSIDEGSDVAKMLTLYGVEDSTYTAIEYNGNILKKKLWGTTILKENDELEIVSFVGGG